MAPPSAPQGVRRVVVLHGSAEPGENSAAGEQRDKFRRSVREGYILCQPPPREIPMTRRATLFLSLALALTGGAACGASGEREQDAMNTLTAAERAQGWRLLFDGTTTDGWRGFRRADMPGGWQVVDGALTRVAAAGDIVTVEQFADFELALDWRLEPGGNSGIFFRATEEVSQIYEGAPEMQVLDDERHADGGSRLTAAGANYGLHPAPRGVVRAAGEWNHVRIIVRAAHVEHWINGVKVVEYELWSPEWEELVRGSKFAAWPRYGRATRGHIGLQDHGDRVAFRNIKIREL